MKTTTVVVVALLLAGCFVETSGRRGCETNSDCSPGLYCNGEAWECAELARVLTTFGQLDAGVLDGGVELDAVATDAGAVDAGEIVGTDAAAPGTDAEPSGTDATAPTGCVHFAPPDCGPFAGVCTTCCWSVEDCGALSDLCGGPMPLDTSCEVECSPACLTCGYCGG